MAYDPKDPADVELVEGMIAEATTKLKAKNEELIGELRKARKDGPDPEKIEKLERELATVQDQLETATKDAKKATTALEKITGERDTHAKRADSLLISTALSKAMIENKIAPQFTDAVEALFGSKATVKVDGESQVVMLGDKDLGAALKEFAASDKGKHYVAAGNNGGGGSGGSGDRPGAKTMTRTAFDAMPPSDKAEFSRTGGTLTDG